MKLTTARSKPSLLNSSQKMKTKSFLKKVGRGRLKTKRKRRSRFIDPNEMFKFTEGVLELITTFFFKKIQSLNLERVFKPVTMCVLALLR